ncbi:hypothetical protein D3C80_1768250 [compost metagenome]
MQTQQGRHFRAQIANAFLGVDQARQGVPQQAAIVDQRYGIAIPTALTNVKQPAAGGIAKFRYPFPGQPEVEIVMR